MNNRFPQPPGVNPSTVFSLKPANGGGNNFRFILNGDAGQKLDVQTSTNLVNWTRHTTVTNVDGRLEIVVPVQAGDRQRYYRAVLSP